MSLITDLNALMKPEAVEKERIRIKSEIDALQHQLDTLNHIAEITTPTVTPIKTKTTTRIGASYREKIRDMLAMTPGMRGRDIAKALGVIQPTAHTCMKKNPSTFKQVGKLWYLADAEVVSRFSK